MEEKNYRKLLGENYSVQNMRALKLLIEYGRLNLQDDNFCKKLKKDISEKDHFYETEFYTDMVDIAKRMAEMPKYDLYELMEDKISILKITTPQNTDLKEKNKNRSKEAR